MGKRHLKRLNNALNNDIDTFLDELNKISRKKGIIKIAKKMGYSRQGVYQSLKKQGNPKIKFLQAILKQFDLTLQFETI